MIPLFRPVLPSINRVGELMKPSIQSGMITNFGPLYEKCRKDLEYRFEGYWLPVTNGTAAITVMLGAGLKKPRQRVAIPDFTFTATGLAVEHAGHEVVLVGCDYLTAAPNIEFLKKNPEKWDALLLVVPFGYRIDTQPYIDLCKVLDRPLFFDLAGAFPMVIEDYPCSYSLHAAKSLPIGEGGLIRLPRKKEFEAARRLTCFDFNDYRESRSLLGGNYKLDEFRCALLLAQLEQWAHLVLRICRHTDLVTAYQDALQGMGIELEAPIRSQLLGYPSLCVLRGLPANAIVREGLKHDIVFKRYYYPFLSEMRAFKGKVLLGQNDPGLKTYVAFPSDLEDGEFDQVVDCVFNAVKKSKR